jgi:tetratricopeptide (TPR) repeat protein
VTTVGRRAIVALALAVATTAPAHGPLQEQIDVMTAQIAQDPSAARLYLRRGELHRLHEDWGAALADYERAAALAPSDDTVDFLRGRALLEAGKPAPARVALDRYLARHPDHAEALITRARTLGALGQFRAAAVDYTHAIERLPRPDPDHYLERARTELAAREIKRALAGLDAGIARLGPVPALQMFAIELELKQGRVDAALVRLDKAAAQSPRKETWLARRGEILMHAGRRNEARSAYAAALAAIEALPASARQTKAIVDLEGRVRSALARR